MPLPANNIINAVHKPNSTRPLFTWRCSCGAKGVVWYSTAVYAVTMGREVHKCPIS